MAKNKKRAKEAPEKASSVREASAQTSSGKEGASKKKKKAHLDYRLAAQNTISMSLRVLLICVIIMIFYVGIHRAYRIGYAIFSEERKVPKGSGVTQSFTIVEGQSAYAIGESLKERALIEDPLVFYLQSEIFEAKIRPGTYEVTTDMTSKELLDLFSSEEASPSVTPTPTPAGGQGNSLPAQGQT